MNEQLTAPITTRHTSSMAENAEMNTPIIPGPSIEYAPSVSKPENAHIDQVEASNIRSEIEGIQDSTVFTNNFNEVISSLNFSEQKRLKQIWKETDSSKRPALLRSLQRLDNELQNHSVIQDSKEVIKKEDQLVKKKSESGKFNVSNEIVYENSSIPNTEEGFKKRIENAKRAYEQIYTELQSSPHHILIGKLTNLQREDLLNRLKEVISDGFTKEQEEAIIAAHLEGDNPVYELNLPNILAKNRILKYGVGYKEDEKVDHSKRDLFSKEEIRILMEFGITGSGEDSSRRSRSTSGLKRATMQELLEDNREREETSKESISQAETPEEIKDIIDGDEFRSGIHIVKSSFLSKINNPIERHAAILEFNEKYEQRIEEISLLCDSGRADIDDLRNRAVELNEILHEDLRKIIKESDGGKEGFSKIRNIEELAQVMEQTDQKWKLPENRIYNEATGRINTANFMNWVRDRIVTLHNDDPDSVLNFMQGIVIESTELFRPIAINTVFRDPGTYLTSGHLMDENGVRFTYEKLKEEIIYEVWLHGGLRNNDVAFKKIMMVEKKNPEAVMSIADGNLVSKPGTMEAVFTTPENFIEDFQEEGGRRTEKDTRIGSAIREAFLIYYNIADYEKLVSLLGEDALYFTKEGLYEATREVMESKKVEVNSDVDIENYLATQEGGIKISSWYDQTGKLRKEKIGEFISALNPYNIPTKDERLINVVRKLVENQAQSNTGVRKGPFGSGYAELLAFYQTYLGGAAGRNDTALTGYNSDTKVEYSTLYQNKQLDIWRGGGAGSIYTLGVLNRTKVDYFTGMPTRDGKSLMQLLEEMHENESELRQQRKFLWKIIEARILKDYKDAGIDSDTLITGSLQKEIDKEMNRILRLNERKHERYLQPDFLEEKERLKALGMNEAEIELKLAEKFKEEWLEIEENEIEANLRSETAGKSIEERAAIVKRELERRERLYEFDINLGKQYKQKELNAQSVVKQTAKKIVFAPNEFQQWSSNQAEKAFNIYGDITSGSDIDPTKFISVDQYGIVRINQEAFINQISDGLIKPARYAFSSSGIPLAQMVRRMVLLDKEADEKEHKKPYFEDMTLAETIFGKDIWSMTQIMVNREINEARKNPNNAESDVYNHELNFVNSDGTISNRAILQALLGAPKEEIEDYENNKEVVDKILSKDFKIVDVDKILVKAYVKVRIARLLQSHSERYSPYTQWDFQTKESLLSGLFMNPYFDLEDVNDIRKFSHNEVMTNIKKDIKKGGVFGNVFIKGFGEGILYFFSKVFG